MSKVTSVRSLHTTKHGWQLFRNRKALWQMMKEAIHGHYRMSFLTTLIIFVSVAYVVFPFDIIPDYIPVLGWLDDGLVIFLLIKRLAFETKRYARFKAMERKHL